MHALLALKVVVLAVDMIDWLTFVVDCPHLPIPAGHFLSITPCGEVDYELAKAVEVIGTYDNVVRVRSQGAASSEYASELYVTGNPAKFIQGHNVFGSDDLCALAAEMVRRVFAALEINDELSIKRVQLGQFSLKRIDVTRSFSLRDRAEVLAVIDSLSTRARSRMGKAQSRGATCYFGKHSRRWSLKFYSKGDELEARGRHKLPEPLRDTPIQAFADNLLRCEVTFRSLELDKILDCKTPATLTPTRLKSLFNEYLERIEVSGRANIPSDELQAMRRCVRDTYLLWEKGVDVRTMMSSPTFYRHRVELLGLGIDIALPNEPNTAEVIPYFRTVYPEPVEVPDWAYTDGLIFDPNKAGG